MQSAKLSARRNLTRDWAGTAGSEREIGATAHPTLPRAGNGRLGHVHVISSGSAREQQKQKHADRRTTSRGGKGRQAGSWQHGKPSNAEAQPLAVSWGGGGGREESAGWGVLWAQRASNRQAETTARSVRSEEGTLQKARDKGWDWQYVAVGSGELFLVYRGHVLILQRPNSLVSQAYRSGTHGNVPSPGESQSGWLVRRLS